MSNISYPQGGGGGGGISPVIPVTSFTPVLKFAGSSTGITYVTQQGTYCQTGPTVFFTVLIALSSKGSFGAFDLATISGLPVQASTNTSYSTITAQEPAVLSLFDCLVYNDGSSTDIYIMQSFSIGTNGSPDSASQSQWQQWTNNNILGITGFYLAE